MTNSSLQYSRDPIVEAILGIEISPLSNDSLATLEALQSLLGSSYTTKEVVRNVEVRFQEEAGTTQQARVLGYVFRTDERQQSVTARVDLFAYNRLKPYPGWDAFRNDAMRLWRLYTKVVGDVTIKQYELRYINRLEIPAGTELSVHLQTFPEIGRDLPQMLEAYGLEVVLPLVRMKGQVILRQSMARSDIEEHVSVILDNTLVFKGDISENDLWSGLEEARHEKNRIFRGCITPAMEDRIR